MRKLSIFIWIMIFMILTNTALAVELDTSITTGGTTISLNMDPDGADTQADTYVVIIPSTVTINPENGSGKLYIKLESGWELNSVHNLYIRLINAQNGIKANTSYNFTLKDANGIEIPYDLTYGDEDTSITADTNHWCYYKNLNLLEASCYDTNEKDKIEYWWCNVKELPDSGVYTDILTFGVFTE